MSRYKPWAFVAACLCIVAAGLLVPVTGGEQRVARTAVPDGAREDTNTTNYRAAEAPITTERSPQVSELVSTSYIGSLVSCKGYLTVSISGWCSTASDSVVVWCVRVYSPSSSSVTVKSISKGTLIAGAILWETDLGFACTNTLEFQTLGASHVQFLFDPVAGSFTPGPAGVY